MVAWIDAEPEAIMIRLASVSAVGQLGLESRSANVVGHGTGVIAVAAMLDLPVDAITIERFRFDGTGFHAIRRRGGVVLESTRACIYAYHVGMDPRPVGTTRP